MGQDGRILRATLILSGVAIAVVTTLRCCTSPLRITQAVHLVRGADGRFDRTPLDEAVDRSWVEVDWSRPLERRNQWQLADSPVHTVLPGREVALYVMDDHPALHALGVAMVEELTSAPVLLEIHLNPPGAAPPPGSRACDLTVALHLEDARRRGLIWQQESCRFFALASTSCALALSGMRPGGPGQWESALLSWRASGLRTSLGITSRSAEGEDYIHEIAVRLAHEVEVLLADCRGPDLGHPALPAGLWPAWSAPPDFTFLDDRTEPVTSTHGYLTVDDTAWVRPAGGDPDGFLARIREELGAGGWEEVEPTLPDAATLWMRNGLRSLKVSRNPERDVIHYRETMDDGALQAVLDGMEVDTTPIPILAEFADRWDVPHREAILHRFERQPPRTAIGALLRCRLLGDAGQRAEAIEALLVGTALEYREERFVDDARLDALCALLGIERPGFRDLQRRHWEAVGVRFGSDEVPATVTREVAPYEQTVFAWFDADRQRCLLLVVEVQGTTEEYVVECTDDFDVPFNWSGQIQQSPGRTIATHFEDAGVRYATRVEPLRDGSDRFCVTVARSPALVLRDKPR